MYRYVLFDLDGTLTDPKEGICKSVQYALDKLGIHEPDLDKLECFIGPPLTDSFRDFYGLNEVQIAEGIKKYRERYTTTGIFENELYPGMEALLKNLSEAGIHLAVASSKPKPFVERILKYFHIDSYFEVIAGGDMNEKKVGKADVVREALSLLFDIPEEKIPVYEKKTGKPRDAVSERECGEESENYKNIKRLLPVDEIIMIGDRKYDVIGAGSFFIDCIGVSYGYAQKGELRKENAKYITDDLDEIYEIITGKKPENEDLHKHAFQKSYHVLLPVVYDFALTYSLLFVLTLLFTFLRQGTLIDCDDWFAANSSRTAVWMDAFTTMVCAVIFFALYQKEKRRHISKVVERHVRERLLRYGGCIIGFGAALSLFLNLIFSFFHIINASETYQETAGIQYSVSIITGLLIYGVIKPIEEELVFRGLVYGRMRRYYPRIFCIPASALIFGAYHGNLVQFLYGFIMGVVLAWLFESFRSLKASILFHGAANVTVYLISMLPVLHSIVFNIYAVFLSGIAAFLFGIFIKKSKLE